MQTRALLVIVSLAAACAAPGGREAPPTAADRWFSAGQAAVTRAERLYERRAGRAHNLILFLGDGMGVSTVTAARIFEGQLRGNAGEENLLSFERLPHVALLKTYNTNQQVADSAGTMTAITTGVKTKAGVIGLDDRVRLGDHRTAAESRVASLFEQAEARGLATGVVSTARITHATPAACYAHVPHRNWEDDSELPPAARAADFPDIARQLLAFPHGGPGDGLDVALGGGRRHFLPAGEGREGDRLDGRDLTAEWAAAPDARYVASRDELMKTGPGSRVLGLFSSSHMKWEADRALDPAGEPSLSEMTRKAIELLSSNPNGFVLMVEAGRIDHGHHASSAYRALHDTVELSQAVAEALEATGDDTLVVVTADHSHVLTISGYPTRGNPILGLVRGNDAHGEPAGELDRDLLGLPFTTLQYANGPGYAGASEMQPEGPKRFPHFPMTSSPARGRPDLSDVDTAAPGYLTESALPLTVERHGGEDVAVYAGGPGAYLFHGVQEQSYLYHAMVAALGWHE